MPDTDNEMLDKVYLDKQMTGALRRDAMEAFKEFTETNGRVDRFVSVDHLVLLVLLRAYQRQLKSE